MDATVEKPKMDTDRAMFVAVAQGRTNRAIKAIRLIGRLDIRTDYDRQDIVQIVSVLRQEIGAMEQRLLTSAKDPDFRLHDAGALPERTQDLDTGASGSS